MVSLSTLQEIENQQRAVRDSEEAFGGLKVVLFCGNFFEFHLYLVMPYGKQYPILMEFLQMPRVSGCGQRLNGQMHQQDDMEYYSLLCRIRATIDEAPKHSRRPMDTKRIKLLCT